MGKELREYRNHLVAAEQKAQEDFDKTVLSLSGGALGISFAFIKDIVGAGPFEKLFFLLFSWISWSSSIIIVLLSFFFSHLALRQAINQVDKKISTTSDLVVATTLSLLYLISSEVYYFSLGLFQ
ncbi:MAG: hypothetical protein PHX78_11450 [bacterium]|nr:hypothetical protein [bacterium]